MYLTFLEYQVLGGTVSETRFSLLELRARRKLDYFTQCRIQYLSSISSEIKECMAVFIERIANMPENGNITSYSNGIESFSYEKNQADALDSELYQVAVEFLPVELITSYVSEV